jgi:hypothetical protein
MAEHARIELAAFRRTWVQARVHPCGSMLLDGGRLSSRSPLFQAHALAPQSGAPVRLAFHGAL